MMRPNVFLILVDALRADRCWGESRRCQTPFLDEFVSQSTIFRKAFSTASMTTCCTASILTGSYPFIHGIRSLADRRLRPDIATLAEVFKANGYYTWAQVTGPLVPATGLSRGFDSYEHREYTQWLDTSWGIDFISSIKKGFPNPWFGLLHLWELHNPRRILAEFDKSQFGINMYDRAVSSLDVQLKKIITALPKDTLIIITGDHGEFVSDSGGGDVISRLKKPFKWLKKRVPAARKLRRVSPIIFSGLDKLSGKNDEIYFNWLGHGYHVYDYLVNVPLILHYHDLFPAGEEYTTLVSHVDLFPTLTAALGFTNADTSATSGKYLMPFINNLDSSYNGESIYLEASGGRTTPLPEQWLAAIRTDQHKYVRGLYNNTLPEELYDLVTDPDESINLASELPDLVSKMRKQLSDLIQVENSNLPNVDTTYSEVELAQLKDRLRDLGYMD